MGILTWLDVVVMMVMVLVIMVVPVVVAAFGRHGQLAAEVGGYERFDRGVRCPGAHDDPVMSEIGQGATTDAARDDDLHTKFAQPAREQPGLVFGCGDSLSAKRQLLLCIHFDQRKFTAAAEVTVQSSVFNRDGDFHELLGLPLSVLV